MRSLLNTSKVLPTLALPCSLEQSSPEQILAVLANVEAAALASPVLF